MLGRRGAARLPPEISPGSRAAKRRAAWPASTQAPAYASRSSRWETRFTALQSGEVDVLAQDTVMNFTRDNLLGIVFVGVNFHPGAVVGRRDFGVTQMAQLNGSGGDAGGKPWAGVDARNAPGQGVRAGALADERLPGRAFVRQGSSMGQGTSAKTLRAACWPPSPSCSGRGCGEGVECGAPTDNANFNRRQTIRVVGSVAYPQRLYAEPTLRVRTRFAGSS